MNDQDAYEQGDDGIGQGIAHPDCKQAHDHTQGGKDIAPSVKRVCNQDAAF